MISLLATLLLVFQASADTLPDCTITYRYIRDTGRDIGDGTGANYYEVFAAEQTLELKSEPDYGCLTPTCAAERAVKIEREGQCRIRRGFCTLTYLSENYRHGALKIRYNRDLMALLVGDASTSYRIGTPEANDVQKALSDTGFCRW